MNRFLSVALAGLATVGLSLASPAVSQARVYAPGRQAQPGNAAPSYFNNYNYGYYPGNYGYGFGGYGYNGYGYNAFNGFGYNGYGYPGYYSVYNVYPNPIFSPNGVVIQPQFGFVSPYGY